MKNRSPSSALETSERARRCTSPSVASRTSCSSTVPRWTACRGGKALDMAQAAPGWHKGGKIEGATDLAAVKGADVVVDDGRFAQARHAARDLAEANADIIIPAARP